MVDSDSLTGKKFGKNVRLGGRSNFLDVFRGVDSVRLKGKYCRITSTETQTDNTSFGISVSRKVGTAVVRNRKKRIIREFLRNNKPLWPSSRKIVIGLDTPVDDETGLLEEIERLLRKIE